MKELVNVKMRGRFFCDGKNLFFQGDTPVSKSLASLLGVRILRDGEVQISVIDHEKEGSACNGNLHAQ